MEVILREDVDKLGRRGDVVKVAEGYGRNFLLPRGLALAVTDANKAMIEKEKRALLARLAKEKAEFQAVADRIGTIRFVAPRKVGENDVLYGGWSDSSKRGVTHVTGGSRSALMSATRLSTERTCAFQ